MKNCPKCHNKGFEPSENFSKPLVNKGKKNHRSFAIRYYACINCGARFKTIEEHYEDVAGNGDLFDEEQVENVEG